jgi:hypothetical protein
VTAQAHGLLTYCHVDHSASGRMSWPISEHDPGKQSSEAEDPSVIPGSITGLNKQSNRENYVTLPFAKAK